MGLTSHVLMDHNKKKYIATQGMGTDTYYVQSLSIETS